MAKTIQKMHIYNWLKQSRLFALFAVVVISCIIVFSLIRQSDVKIAQVDGEIIYLSEIEEDVVLQHDVIASSPNDNNIDVIIDKTMIASENSTSFEPQYIFPIYANINSSYPFISLYFDMNNHQYNQWSYADVCSYFNTEFSFDLPSDLTQSDKPFFDQFGIEHNPTALTWTVIYDRLNNLVFDNIKYEYRNIWEDKYIANLRKLRISFSKFDYPANCDPYEFVDAEPTLVNGVSVYFGVINIAHYMVRGYNNGLYFFVESDNLSEVELVNCVISVVRTTQRLSLLPRE
ncbi:MAG: hypothetical protein LBH86_06950 [Oscillospiraceae bacterium]|nr:hypothetical protein [Oscillospiraceae bacterium]